MSKSKTKIIKPFFPSKIYVYACDYEHEEPIFAVTTNLDDLTSGDDVAEYELTVFGVVNKEVSVDISKRKVVK